MSEEPMMDGSLFGGDQACFGCGTTHPIGFRLRFAKQGEDSVVTELVPGSQYQGPPGIMHGGLVMTLADEVAAWTLVGQLGRFGFTTRVEGALRKAVRVGHPVEATGTLQGKPGRVADVAVAIRQDDALCFEGKFRFALLGKDAAEKLLGGPLPDAWAKMARKQ